MEKDFQSAPKRFWQTIRRLRRGKRGSIQAVYSKGGTLLTSTEEVIGRWKEHFEELLNPTTPSMVETELEDEGRQTSISLEEVTAGRDVGAALRTAQPGCPRRVLLGLVAQEACRLSKTSRRRRITLRELTAALALVRGRTRTRAAA
ncbi:hypothetical protein NHX12_003742 [Muraenolepis orangiensis]|uniref:Uncharacterized protein n=1 Tax=Muraenolepis orangiensis TaxID=630683 RepID=A0A9Q0DT69_9TELE|nr:hypothetical protein NHX12_003742 [Muraenolepis orangiensis]